MCDVWSFPLPQVTELLDVSMELGCFLAGALISSQGHMVTEEIVSYIEPIRDFLAIIFFASIGNLLYVIMFELYLLNTCRSLLVPVYMHTFIYSLHSENSTPKN